jgi:HEXXH motif-containing protein
VDAINIGTPSLDERQIETLAAGFGDAAVIDTLRRGHVARVVAVLRSMEVRRAGRVAEAIDLLRRAEQADPVSYLDVVSYPQVMAWSAIVDVDASDANVDHLRSVAAAAGHRCGVDFAISVPVRAGCVVLPGIGSATVASSDFSGMARVESSSRRTSIVCGDHRVVVPADDARAAIEWQAVRRVTAEAGGLVLDVLIDDVDPYRSTYGLSGVLPPSDRLDDVGFKIWSETIADAWRYLVEHHEQLAVGIAAGVRSLIPIADEKYPRHDRLIGAFGVVAVANVSTHWVAYALLEEFQRMKVAATNNVLPLWTDVNQRRYFVPWMTAPVNFLSLFEGLYAAPAVCSYWATYSRTDTEREATVRSQLHASLWAARIASMTPALIQNAQLTEVGVAFVDRMMSTCSATDLAALQVGHDIRSMAALTERDFRISWRLQNLVPDAEQIDRLVDAWTASDPCPVVFSLTVRGREGVNLVRWRVRRWLLIRKVAHPNWFLELRDDDAYLRALDASAQTEDALMVDGADAVVADRCLTAIVNDVDDLEAWALLALARRSAADLASISLTRFPEIVSALYAAIVSTDLFDVDVLEVATWVAPLLLTQRDDFSMSTE